LKETKILEICCNFRSFILPYLFVVYLSQYLTNLMHKIYFTISVFSCLYMFRAHVLIIRMSELLYKASGIITPIGVTVSFISCLYMFRAHVLIIRRSKLQYIASGIITPIGASRRRPPIVVMIPEAVYCNFHLLMMSTCARNM